ncbi:MAG: substrate-binding domain-containing protein [Acutalibacter sp.]|nr:substrate-binding domain-containing protein [Acutalibacter sp.]
MKRIFSLILAIVLLSVCLAGCTGNSSSGSAAGNSEKFKIGVLAPTVTEGWDSGVTYYAEKRCQALAIDGEIEYRLFRCDSGEDVSSGVEQLRIWGVQAVVVYPQWDDVEEALQALIDDGIPVFSFEKEPDCKGLYRISFDNEDIGRQSATYIVDKVGNSGTVILLNNPSAGAVSTLRQKGFEEKVAEIAPNLTVYTYAAGFTREDGQRAFEDILSEHDQIDAVFSMSDETSMGVLSAVREKHRTDIQVITGVGGSQEYLGMIAEEENADITLQTVLYSPVSVEKVVNRALALLKGERVRQTETVSTTVVDRENCERYLDEKSPY